MLMNIRCTEPRVAFDLCGFRTCRRKPRRDTIATLRSNANR